MKKIIIGFSGKAEAGKTTAANAFFKKMAPMDLCGGIVPLAKKMKEQARYLGWDGKKDERGRRFLQEVSWPIKHYLGEDVYAKWVLEDANRSYLNVILVDDVRMLAEVNYFKSLPKDEYEFVLVRIERPNHVSKLTPEQLADVSETQLDNYEFDYHVVNDGTIEELGDKLSEILTPHVIEAIR